MKLSRLKDTIGFTLVGLHLLAIGLAFALLQPLMEPESFRVTVLILSPVTAIYALAYLREVAKNFLVEQGQLSPPQFVTPQFAILAVLFTLAFSVGIIYTIYDFSRGNIASADNLKASLATIETALGAFLGLIIETLFGKVPANTSAPPNADAKV